MVRALSLRIIAGASIGNALEFYDFLIYGFFAADLAEVYFPGGDPTTRLLLSFGVFGVSFFARPVGALVLGTFADHSGRVACMVLCVSLMTLAAALIALMPPYSAIGIAAPLGILLARLIQGFALGGEFGSATALMIEHSERGEAGAASWQGISQNLAGLLASGVAFGLSGSGASHGVAFRVAFGLGALAGPVALLLRRNLLEAPAYLAQRRQPPPPAGKPTVSGIAITAGMVAIGTAQTYLTIYLPTYASRTLHLPASRALGPILLQYVFLLALTPWRLAIARQFDRTHHVRPMLISCLVMMASGYPAFMLLTLWPTPAMLFLLSMGLAIAGLYYNAPLAGFMGMVFSLHRRGVGLAIGYAVGIALFGGSAPFINTWLIAQTGDPRSPGLYLIFASLVSMGAIAAARWRLRRG